MSPLPAQPLNIEYALLGLLQAGPMHGYQLHQIVNAPQGLKPVWTLKQSQLYALMGRLELAGYVHVTVEPQENRPPRRVFHLTTAGQRAFNTWLATPVQKPRQMRQEFQLKVFFARLKGKTALQKLLTAQRRVCETWLSDHMAAQHGKKDANDFARVVDRYRQGQIQAMITWLDQCAEESASLTDPN